MTRPSWTTHSHAFAGCMQSGTHFPNGWGFGKCVQEFAFGVGCSFQLRALAENATRNLRSEWDGVSQRGRKRKLHPIPDMGLRTRFPDAKRPHDVAFNLYMFSRCPHDKPRFNTEASARPARNVRFIASSARAGEHLMCSPCESGLSEQATSYAAARPGRTWVQNCQKSGRRAVRRPPIYGV